ncbi:MAG: flagellar biosynthesis protein FlhF [Desulfarculus sp.]|nr:flagellar biosynthesis protein FlhF [Desulfarculus sp.]
MRVMRFTAPTMAQAMRQVRQSLGPDAVILSTGRLPGGGVEISAAMDQALSAAAGGGAPEPQAAPAPDPDPAPAGPGLEDLARRVDGLSGLVSRHLVMSEAAGGFAARPEVAPLYTHLMEQEVDPAIIAELLGDLAAPGGQNLLPRLAIRLKKLLQVSPGPRLGTERPAVWALVGPTGVGKTTTVAKLAATYGLKHRLKVGLITLDTFRIAAPEQLMVYGRIMDLPAKVAATAAEYAQAVAELNDRDLVLVDTVGRSQSDQENLAELKAVLAGVPRTLCHLVLACPTRGADLKLALEGFGIFEPQSLIFTKLDETRTFGPILNLVVKSGRPVSYLANGQRVPDDLEEATREGLAKRLLPPRGGLQTS